MADMAMEGRWEGKGVAVFYLELTLDMLRLLVYCAFFAVVFSTYGIPLHLVSGWLRVADCSGWLWAGGCGAGAGAGACAGGWAAGPRHAAAFCPCWLMPYSLPCFRPIDCCILLYCHVLPPAVPQVRDLYWTFRNFQTRVRDFLRYRRLTGGPRWPGRAGQKCVAWFPFLPLMVPLLQPTWTTSKAFGPRRGGGASTVVDWACGTKSLQTLPSP